MAKTTNSGFWSDGIKELTPLDGSTSHGARLRKSIAPEHHVVQEPVVAEPVEETEIPDQEKAAKVPAKSKKAKK